jgi:hypothetical protein
MDLQMFIKLMGMTTSSHDNEALTALRKANAMLVANNLTWQEFLDFYFKKEDRSWQVPPSQRRQQKPAEPDKKRYDDAEEIELMFDMAFAGAKGSFVQFLESLRDWFEQKQFLTKGQYEALKRAANQ